MQSMTVSESGGGGFIRVLGIIYLIRLFQVRRRRRREARADGEQREEKNSGAVGNGNQNEDHLYGLWLPVFQPLVKVSLLVPVFCLLKIPPP